MMYSTTSASESDKTRLLAARLTIIKRNKTQNDVDDNAKQFSVSHEPDSVNGRMCV